MSFRESNLSDDCVIQALQSLCESYELAKVRDGLGFKPVVVIPPDERVIGPITMDEDAHDFCCKFETLANPHSMLGRGEAVHASAAVVKEHYADLPIDAFIRRVGRTQGVPFDAGW
jgi:hypothetical protein